jgi:hypothetical protein
MKREYDIIVWNNLTSYKTLLKVLVQRKQDLLGQVSRLRKREGQKYANFYGKS